MEIIILVQLLLIALIGIIALFLWDLWEDRKDDKVLVEILGDRVNKVSVKALSTQISLLELTDAIQKAIKKSSDKKRGKS